MSNSYIDLSAVTFTADEIRDFNELIRVDTLEAPALTALHPIETDIRNDQNIGFIGSDIGLIGKAVQGCGTQTYDNKQFPATQKVWSPKRWEVPMQFCWTDVSSNLLRFLRKLGADVVNLESTPIMAFFLELLQPNLQRMLFRYTWFNDTDAANTDDSPSGVLTEGVDVTYFNLFNGAFRQLSDIITTTPARKTNIAANEQASYALQDSAYSNEQAFTDLFSVIDDAPLILTLDPSARILVTHSVWRRVMRHLQTKSIVFELDRTINGMPLMRFDGYEIISMPMWDAMIRAYEKDGTKYNNPHRILMTTGNNIPIGLEGNDFFLNANIWHEEKDKYTYVRLIDAMDVKVLRDDLVQYGI